MASQAPWSSITAHGSNSNRPPTTASSTTVLRRAASSISITMSGTSTLKSNGDSAVQPEPSLSDASPAVGRLRLTAASAIESTRRSSSSSCNCGRCTSRRSIQYSVCPACRPVRTRWRRTMPSPAVIVRRSLVNSWCRAAGCVGYGVEPSPMSATISARDNGRGDSWSSVSRFRTRSTGSTRSTRPVLSTQRHS